MAESGQALGLLWLITLEAGPGGFARPVRLEAVPLKLEFGHTRPARGDDLAWIRRRFTSACSALGTNVSDWDGRLVTDWP